MDAPENVTQTLDLCLRIGDLLMSNGAGAADVSVTMDAVAREYGLRNAEIDVTFTTLSIGYQQTPDDFPRVLLRQVLQRTIDFADLTEVDHLVTAILAGRLSCADARARVGKISSTGHLRPRWAVTLGWGGMCAGVAAMLGGNAVVIASALVAAVGIDRLQLLLHRRRLPVFYQQVAGGMLAMLVAVAVSLLGLVNDPSLVVTANIVMLLSGVGFMGALQDALSGFYITSAARLIEAILATAGILAGVAGGLALVQVVGLPVGDVSPGSYDTRAFVTLGFGAALAAIGFTYASHGRKRMLIPVGLVGGVALMASRLLESIGFGRMWSVAVAAVLVGVVAYPIARRINVPPLTVVVACVVPLLPGLSIYRSLALLSEAGSENISAGIFSMVVAASIALSLAAGVILGEYVAQPLATEARRLERRFSGPRLIGPIRWTSRRSRARR